MSGCEHVNPGVDCASNNVRKARGKHTKSSEPGVGGVWSPEVSSRKKVTCFALASVDLLSGYAAYALPVLHYVSPE